jgi:hypothetical protein
MARMRTSYFMKRARILTQSIPYFNIPFMILFNGKVDKLYLYTLHNVNSGAITISNQGRNVWLFL